MDLKKYNNLLNSERWTNKDTKDAHILNLVGVAQKLADESNKSSEKSYRESTKCEPAYIRYIPLWMLEDQKMGLGNKTKDGKEYW